MAIYLTQQTDLFEKPSARGCVGNKVRRSQLGEPVRVLDCVVPAKAEIPGYICIEDSHARLQWFYENTLDLVQVGEPPNVGFALVPRRTISDVPF